MDGRHGLLGSLRLLDGRTPHTIASASPTTSPTMIVKAVQTSPQHPAISKEIRNPTGNLAVLVARFNISTLSFM